MKRFISLTLLCCFLAINAMAQNVEVLLSNYNQLQLKFHAFTPQVSEVSLFGETYTSVSMDNSISSLEVGKPALPMMTQIVEIPLCEDIDYTISEMVCDTLDARILGINHPIIPAQASRSKSDRSTPVLNKDAALYNTNAFYGTPLFSIEQIGVARSKNLATAKFCPMQYNPVTNQVIIVKHCTVTVNYKRADVSATQQMASRYGSSAFGFNTINQLPCSKEIANAQQAPIHYLIVAHSMFRGQLDEFIAWKQRKGFIVTVGYTDEANVGTTSTAIAAWIKSFYTNATAALPAPTYLLIVGDHEQIPAFSGRYGYSGSSNGEHVTDLYYTTWTTGDCIPDCYHGRFSAQNASQLTPQIEKTLMYEQYAFPDPSFLSTAILIAGEDQGYSSDNAYRCADPAMDYIAKTYANADNGFSTVYYYKNNTNFAPDGVTVNGSSQTTASAAALRNLYSAGAGWINYSAHGDVTEWYKPNFTNSNISSMTNNNKFGFVIGSCCLTNKFDQSTCFGEAWLRKGNYAGAVGYIGGSNSTYWNEDFYWAVGIRNSLSNTMNTNYDATHLGAYDRLFHTHGEDVSQWYTSASSLMMAGNMAVQASTSSGKNYYWEIYHLMGDPSVMPWLGQAQEMNVSASSILPLGTGTFSVTAVPNAYCAITNGAGTLIGAAFADASGNATINTSSLVEPGTYELAVTAQGYQPYFSEIAANVLEGPYVKCNNVSANLVAGTQQPITVEIENVGTEATDNLSIELIVDNHHLFLNTPGQITLSNINVNQTISVTGMLDVNVLSQVADQTSTQVTAILRWGNSSSEQSRKTTTLIINAPKIAVTGSNITGTLQPSHNIQLALTVANQGHADISNLEATIIPVPGFTCASATQTIGSLNTSAAGTAHFSLTLDSWIPENIIIPIHYTLSNGSIEEHGVVDLKIGTGSTEDFESGSFNTYDWVQGTKAWEICTSEKHQGSYSARSKTWSTSWSGDNGNSSSSELSITYTSSVNDSISFWYKVSSEAGYDKFIFYVDGTDKFDASGEEDWRRYACYIPAGTHTFTFSYEKDYSMARGSDCAWIDDITFPRNGTAYSYKLDTICQGEDYTMPTHTVSASELTLGSNNILRDSTNSTIYYVKLTVVEAPEVSISAETLSINCGESVLLTATGADSYLWDNGVTNHQIRVYPTQTTTYTVVGSNGACTSQATITITVTSSAGIQEQEVLPLTIYPNPTIGMITVDGLMDGTVSIFDMTGRCMMQRNASSSTISLDLTHLPQGIYILRNGSHVKKIVRK